MKKDWLLAVGCSLTWGSDTTIVGSSVPEDKANAWPAHLGNLLRADTVINRGWPGRSNGSIYRVAQEELVRCYQEYGTSGMVVIQWTGPARLELVNPFKIDVPGEIKKTSNTQHPGTEGSFLCVTPQEICGQNGSLTHVLPGVFQYFTTYWAYDFYQQELLINYSISLTSLANRLGVTILQFNGIDQLTADSLQPHAAHMISMIGKEYMFPTNRDYSFWNTYYSVKTTSGWSELPSHPTTSHHIDWANKLYNYSIENQSN